VGLYIGNGRFIHATSSGGVKISELEADDPYNRGWLERRIGGWVPFLYRRYGGFETWTGGEALAFEVDIVSPPKLPAKDRPELTRLLQSAGFRPLVRGRRAAVWAKDPERGRPPRA
jgi:hypothetical protein